MTTFSNKWYDLLGTLVKIVLPALVTLYASLGAIWGWGNVEQVVATAGAVTLFLGVLLTISKKNYSPPTDGQITLHTEANNEGYVHSSLDIPMEKIHDGNTIRLMVREPDKSQ